METFWYQLTYFVNEQCVTSKGTLLCSMVMISVSD